MKTMAESLPRSWLTAVPILLLAAALALAQIDRFGPSQDAFLSLNNAGWAGDSARSLGAALDSLRQHSPQHAPLHYLLLHAWGRLVGHDLAMARVLSVFLAVLGYAALYRLARENIAPVAGLFAMALLAGNAFYSHYIAYARMYSQLVVSAALAVWLYTRMLDHSEAPGAKGLIAWFVACLALLATHAHGLVLFAALALHHLLVARKDALWRRISLAAGAAFACFAPWLIGVMSTPSSAEGAVVTNPATLGEFLLTWLTVTGNGSLILLAVTGAGWLVAQQRLRRRLLSRLMMLALFVALACLAAAATDSVSTGRMRYMLAGMPLAALALAAGLHAWHLRRWWLAWLLLALWLVAGWLHALDADWDDLLGQRARAYWLPPWHVISRHALDSQPNPAIVAYRPTHHQLTKGTKFGLSQADHYFGQYDMQVRQTNEFQYLEEIVKDLALREPVIWLVTQGATLDAAGARAAERLLDDHGYAVCGQKRFTAATTVTDWRWTTLRCAEPQLAARHNSGSLAYEFYGANLYEQASSLEFRYRWRAVDNAAENQRISHQLLDADWRNVAQLDLPLAHENDLLRFRIDIAQVPPGEYQLMAIVYNAQTGKRLAWQDNDGWIPEMRQLAEIQIPATVRETP